MMKIYKMVLLAAVYISMGIGLTIFLPNLPAIDNRIHGRENVVILPEQIREVTVENAREVDTGPSGAAVLPITGCYIQCGHRKIHQIFLQTEAKLVPGVVNIYYILQAQEPYSERHCIKRKLIPWSGGYLLQIDKAPYGMRIDLADDTGNQVHLDSAMINPDRIRIAGENILPWVTFPLLLILLLYGKRKYIFTEIWQCRKMLCKLSKNDLRSKHAGMALGRVWAYIQPLLTIFVMWYVFQVGFKNPPIRKTQFIIWFMAGYLPWMYCSDAIMGMTDAIADYSYLVKKISFRVSLLPVIRLLSALRVHVFFLTMFSIVLVLYHHFPELIWFQVVYYTFALSFLLFSVGLLLSALSVMLRDFSRLVGVMLQVLFWYTPVVWNSEEISASALYIFRINPLFYIVQGYRDTCIDHIWVWDKPVQNVMFWMICMICLWSAAVIFHRCRPHFADLL